MVTFENAVLVGIAIVVIWAVCSLRDKLQSMASAIDKTLYDSNETIRDLIIDDNTIKKEFRYNCMQSRIEQLANEVSIYKSANDENKELRVCNAKLETENKFLKERVDAFESVDADTRFIRYMNKYFIISSIDYHCVNGIKPGELDSLDICAVEIIKDGVVHD